MKRFLVVVLLGLTWTAHAEEDRKTVLFLGDSLTAGYGLDKTQAFSRADSGRRSIRSGGRLMWSMAG